MLYRGFLLIRYAPWGGGGGGGGVSSLLYISIAYQVLHAKQGGGGEQIACKSAYVINALA